MRSLLFLIGVAGLVAGLFALKFDQFDHAARVEAQAAQAGPPPTTVSVVSAAEARVEKLLRTVGSIVAKRTVNVTTSSPGLVTARHFDSGQRVNEGAVLVELDTRVERARLREIKAQQRLAGQNLRRNRPLQAKGTVAASRVDGDVADVAMARARAEALEAEIALKTIRAPFTGQLGLRQIEVGAYLTPGTVIAELIGDGGVYADLIVPQKDLARVAKGATVRLMWPGAQTPATAIVETIAPSLSPHSRSATLRAAVASSDAVRLRPGMFVSAEIPVGEERAIQLPATAIVRSSFGDSVFIVVGDPKRGDIARSRPITLGPAQGDLVTVKSGLEVGERVVAAGAFKLWEGAGVRVDERPAPDRSTKPELPNE